MKQTTRPFNEESDFANLVAPQTVRLQRLLPGSIERVWSFLTDSALRQRWLAAGDMTLEAGAPFELVWRNDELTDPPGLRPDGFSAEHRLSSRIIEVDPPRRLVFTWMDGQVSMDLEPRGEQVQLTLVHQGISDRNNLLMVGAGWHMHLDILRTQLGGAPTLPFWDGWSRLRAVYDQRIPK